MVWRLVPIRLRFWTWYIEINPPFDLMKYEIDKVSGYLRVDRPQRSSAQPPTLYGFVPRNDRDERVRSLAPTAKIEAMAIHWISASSANGRSPGTKSSSACPGHRRSARVTSTGERPTTSSSACWTTTMCGAGARNISDVPSVLVERLQHYFLTYKLVPGQRSAGAYC